jgi:hypothetical protein
MTHEQAPDCHSAAAQPLSPPLSRPALSRRQLIAWTLLGLLLPLSVLTALVVLHLMAASAAAATGGCGGG